MRYKWAYLTAICASLIVSLDGRALAQSSAERVRHYRFLPRLSVLNETGGIYPRDTDFRVFGPFDFVTASDPRDVWPSRKVAQFENVEAWASHPILAYVVFLDDVLNLSGLSGHQLPVLAPFDIYKFEGTTDDGSSVELFASDFGRWLRLRGKTTPPPGSADMFVYKLSAVARQRPFADFNGNDAVDSGDLARWMTRFGASPSVADTMPLGDADDDQRVDGADFLTWQRQLGEESPAVESLDAMTDAALASLSASVAALPEPGSLGLLAAGAILLTGCCRRR